MAGPVLGVRCDRGKPRGTFKFPATQLWTERPAYRKFVTAEPAQHVGFPKRLLQQLGESGQRPVTLSMTEAVIDLLKEVQVEE
jgi:hypothetical protein